MRKVLLLIFVSLVCSSFVIASSLENNFDKCPGLNTGTGANEKGAISFDGFNDATNGVVMTGHIPNISKDNSWGKYIADSHIYQAEGGIMVVDVSGGGGIINFTSDNNNNKTVYIRFKGEVNGPNAVSRMSAKDGNVEIEYMGGYWQPSSANYYYNAGVDLLYSGLNANQYYQIIIEMIDATNKRNLWLYDDTDALLGSITGVTYPGGVSAQIDRWFFQSNTINYSMILVINGSIADLFALNQSCYTGTVLAPTITKIYPTEALYTNSFSGWINFSATDLDGISKCWLNDSRFIKTFDNSTHFGFYNSTAWNDGTHDGKFNINISCNDTTGLEAYTPLTFTIDTSPPDIASNIENNHTYWTLLQNLQINSTVTDNLDYIIINDSCGYTFFNTSISAPYNYNQYINITGCSLGQQHTNITVCDLASNCDFKKFLWYSMARLNITANSSLGDGGITTFSIYQNGTLKGSTTGGVYSLDNLSAGYINITIDAVGYELKSSSVYINTTFSIHKFNLYSTNSLNITLKEEATGTIITTDNITIRFSSSTQEWTNISDDGGFYIDNLLDAEYSLLFTSASYEDRTYTITVANRSHQELTIYLAANTSTTIFTITDIDTSSLLSYVLGTMYRMINNTWQPVESKYSDITGKIQFNYLPSVKYKFYLSKSEYEDYIFYLDPILYSSYDINMQKSITQNNNQDYDKIAIIYYPSTFQAKLINNFSLLIQSPYGELLDYGFNLTYPGGTNTTSGTNSIGGQLTVQFNITGATAYDTVRVDYWYNTAITGTRYFTYYFPIANIDTGPTLYDNNDNTYGLGLFERVLIMSIMVIIVVGIATLVGQPIPGIALGFFLQCFFVYNGFIPLWAVLPGLFVGVVFLGLKS
jgi:hypothetical protein